MMTKRWCCRLTGSKCPAGHDAGREVFFNLGNKKSFVMRLEVSPEERIAFSSAKKDKIRLAAAVEKSGGLVFDRT